MSKFQLDNGCSCLLELSITVYIQSSGRAWHWNWFVYTILRYFSKEQTSNLQSHVFLRCMLLVSETYFRDLLSTCTACKRWVNCLVLTVLHVTQICKQLLCKLTKCKKCLYSIIINQAKLYNYHLFTETEGNSVFCGPETAVVARGNI
jgi:hypothetical protein